MPIKGEEGGDADPIKSRMDEIVLIAILFAVDLQNIEDRFVLKEVVPRQSLRFSESNVFLEGRIIFSPAYVGEAEGEIAN